MCLLLISSELIIHLQSLTYAHVKGFNLQACAYLIFACQTTLTT